MANHFFVWHYLSRSKYLTKIGNCNCSVINKIILISGHYFFIIVEFFEGLDGYT